MARFFFNSEGSVNFGYTTLQAMARRVAETTADPGAFAFPPSPALLDQLVKSPAIMSELEKKIWALLINVGTDLSGHDRWNNFMANPQRFADAYRALLAYDFADGLFDGVINYHGQIRQFPFGNLETCDNGAVPKDSSDLPQCRPANLWLMEEEGEGSASFYSTGFVGQRTSAETVYDTTEFSVAHRTLPLGTIIAVCSKEQCLNAIVSDRGPYANTHGTPRVLDLSPAVFKALGHKLSEGVIPVTYTVVRFPEEDIFPAH